MDSRHHTREQSGWVLDREGRWLHGGEPVEHPRIIEALNRSIERGLDGRYRLCFGGDWCFVTVEDAPLQVISALEANGQVSLKLSNGAGETLRAHTLSVRSGVLYCVTEAGWPARLSRSAQFVVGGLLEDRPGGLMLLLGGREYPVAVLPSL